MKRDNQDHHKKDIAAVVAMAGVLSLSAAPVWGQQGTSKATREHYSSASRQQDKMAAGMITASDLQDHRVLDAQNREIGTITNLFIDSQSGRIQRADIEFNGSIFGRDHEYSVAWDKLKVREQGDDVVVTLDESVVRRVQQAGATGRVTEGDGIYSQRQRDGDVIGSNDSRRKQQEISAAQLSSEQIRKVQQKLNQQGFHAGQVNGKWSSETQNAISNFQQMKGLKTTGQLDERTLDQLGLEADEFRSKGAER
jgi:sporulation protein YlmC with PRC-barrel domain